ncbi:hypothetical protein ABZ656_11915 [Streptomyces sp. NPDC007095]|uniref:hypothetical protein n=1 Tax=Streptomyces sp. NPDC007095 TaxID=3154482 RepID=UPI0033C316E7
MCLVPAEHSHHRLIDGHRICHVIDTIGEPGRILPPWAERFSPLSWPLRPPLFMAPRQTGPLAVRRTWRSRPA